MSLLQNVSDKTSPILGLPVEIFHLVASHIPLQCFPTTVSALALTSRQINRNVTSILYSKMVIRSMDYVHEILDRINKDKELGLLIRELHILADDTAFKKEKKRPMDEPLIEKLHNAIRNKHIPHLARFSLVFFSNWNVFHPTTRDLSSHYLVPRDFWVDLERFCPHLRGVLFRGSGAKEDDPRMLYELIDRSLTLDELDLKSTDMAPSSLISIPDLARSLRYIDVVLAGSYTYLAIDSLLSNNFPFLESFAVSGRCLKLKETSKAMSFWTRHPGLEKLSLCTPDHDAQWFSLDGVEAGLLPRLTHLRATFKNIRAIASHLGQLRHLSVTHSLNCQVPYLLRSVVPGGGLPHLKSLEINQSRASTGNMSEEGTRWYEYASGKIIQTACKGESMQRMPVGYIHSIVRGAPNIEELCLQGDPIERSMFEYISRHLAQFNCLERLYFRAFKESGKILNIYDISVFVCTCQEIATSCRTLRLVTDVSVMDSGSYLTGKIIRDSGGLVTDVVPGRGFGMEFTGGHNNPFPDNPLMKL